jgi:hypothetical protein
MSDSLDTPADHPAAIRAGRVRYIKLGRHGR